MISDWFISLMDWILLTVDSLLRNSRWTLGFIIILIMLFAFTMIAPLFIQFNVSYPLPVCGIFYSRPAYARIFGPNKVILRASKEDLDFSVSEGNYLVTILKQKELSSDKENKKLSVDFEVAPSAIWKIPQDRGEIVVRTVNPSCKFSLYLGLDWWSVSIRFFLGIASVIQVWTLIKALFGK